MSKSKVILLCDECLSRNYSYLKTEGSDKKIEIKKHCTKCNKHTLHKETR